MRRSFLPLMLGIGSLAAPAFMLSGLRIEPESLPSKHSRSRGRARNRTGRRHVLHGKRETVRRLRQITSGQLRAENGLAA